MSCTFEGFFIKGALIRHAPQVKVRVRRTCLCLTIVFIAHKISKRAGTILADVFIGGGRPSVITMAPLGQWVL